MAMEFIIRCSLIYLYSTVNVYLSSEAADNSVYKVRIGALLDSAESIEVFNEFVRESPNHVTRNKVKVIFEPIATAMSDKSVESANQVCELMSRAEESLVGLVVSHPESMEDEPPLAASFIASYYNMPIVSVSARHSTFSDKYSHQTFMRTVPPYNQEAQIFARMINEFEWNNIIVIHTSGDEGDMFLSQLQREDEQKFKIKVDLKLPMPSEGEKAGWEDIRVKLSKLTNKQTRVVVLYADRVSAAKVFTMAHNLTLFTEGWAWLVSEDALRVNNSLLPAGVVGINLEKGPLSAQIRDAVRVIKYGVLQSALTWEPGKLRVASNCTANFSDPKNPHSVLKEISEEMWRANLRGETGVISFDRQGDREQANYSIVNVMELQGGAVDIVNVGNCTLLVTEYRTELINLGPISEIKLNVDMAKVKWPGNYSRTEIRDQCVDDSDPCSKTTQKKVYLAPISFKKKTVLRVVTQESVPFVYKRPLNPGSAPCDVSENYREFRKEVPCSHTDPETGNVTHYCCYGYNIDLLRQLASRPHLENLLSPFTYTLHLVGDGKIGQHMGDGEWNGIVKELYEGKADLAVAPLPITPQRAALIEFTKPFKYLGFTILVKRSLPKSNLVSFLQPFDYTLWVLVFLSVHVVALVLYLLDRFSPFGRFKLANSSDTEEDALNLASAMWFAWGVLLNSGIGEGTPRSFSARVLGMVWAGFAMIIVASYTANLAAFLVLDRPEALISGIDDARMRNPTKDFVFATVKNSTVEHFFKRRLEYATMYKTMEQHMYHNVDAAIEAVRSRKLNAFIWDSARLNYEATSECDLMTAGEVFGRFGYGLAMTKGSPWIREMSQAVLNFHELGVMELLDSQWILNKAKGCPPTNSLSPATLGLNNMAGVFIMVAAGIVAGVFLIFIEMAYKKRTGMKEKELELAKCAADRWRGNIEKRKVLRRGRTASHYGDLTPSNGGSPNAMYATSNLTEHVSLDHKGSIHHFDS